MIIYPGFNSKLDFQKHMFENKNMYFDKKMEEGKFIEPKIAGILPPLSQKGTADKSLAEDMVIKVSESELLSSDALKVLVAINTTNYFDSHRDVHIPKIWDKSLARGTDIVFLNSHQRGFSDVIADDKDLSVFVKNMMWSELGFSFIGKTQALLFDAIIRKVRNSFMFDQYAMGFVKRHSVGMIYRSLVLAINNESYGAEFEAWQKYISMVANVKAAEDSGIFWAVKEADISEGSAVVLASNAATPTLSVEIVGSQKKQLQVEEKQAQGINFENLNNKFELNNQ